MKLLSGQDIKAAIQSVRPHSIAVAFVGIDWRAFLEPSGIKDLIISPRIGTNPRAVSQIIAALGENGRGWENVHFLDALHAKVYIGDQGVALGSFNLTGNGLRSDEHGLIEAGVWSDDAAWVADTTRLFADLLQQAKRAYPSVESKKTRLAQLEREWNAMATAVKVTDQADTLASYYPQTNTAFYVGSTDGTAAEYDEERVKEYTRDMDPADDHSIDDLVEDGLSFLAGDDVKTNQWLLRWETKKDGTPRVAKNAFRWIYIHDVIENGTTNDAYTKFAVQWKMRGVPENPPFSLTDQVTRTAIVNVLNSGRFPEFLPEHNVDGEWSLNPTFLKFLDFVAALREEARALGDEKAAPRVMEPRT